MTPFTAWTPDDAASRIAVPGEHDDKYSRGVLGVITGSAMYPGAAVLGVQAAAHTGIGMIRYLGEAAELVLQRRPEVVTADGRVQAWLLGSGMDHVDRQLEPLLRAVSQEVPVVLDGGALDLHDRAAGPVVITPHYGELARLLGVDRAEVAGDPEGYARRTADSLGVTVLLKGHTTYVAGPGISLSAASAPTWLATRARGMRSPGSSAPSWRPTPRRSRTTPPSSRASPPPRPCCTGSRRSGPRVAGRSRCSGSRRRCRPRSRGCSLVE
ncbi:MAG: NAD(P)H-hydrate dehydratase [Rhodoglobus sp.]|nr:NAD(P)H-hydrate dehydratase [Rhodoglobus sp.]